MSQVFFMQSAYLQALKAYALDEVPVGAAIFLGNCFVAGAFNQTRCCKSATAHAEMLVINKACKLLGNERLLAASLYVTLEPCAMCMGAIAHARLQRVCYGAKDPKTGFVDYFLKASDCFNHQPIISGGIMSEECGSLLRRFFESKRR